MALRPADAVFLHCLPAHRGEEVDRRGHRRPALDRLAAGRQPAADRAGAALRADHAATGTALSAMLSRRRARRQRAAAPRPAARRRPPSAPTSRRAVRALAELAREHDVVVTHGNGPQVGLLALQGEAYRDVDALPARRARRRERGHDRLPARAGARQRAAAARAGRDAAHAGHRRRRRPGVRRAREAHRPRLRRGRPARRSPRERGWTVAPDGRCWRRVVPSPEPRAIVELGTIRLLVDAGVLVVCAGGGGIPVVVDRDGRAARRRGRRRQGPRRRAAGRAASAPTRCCCSPTSPRVEAGCGTPDARPLARRRRRASCAGSTFAAGSMGPKVEAACRFADATGGLAGHRRARRRRGDPARRARAPASARAGCGHDVAPPSICQALLDPAAYPHRPDHGRAARDAHLVGVPRRRPCLQGQEAGRVRVPRLRHAGAPARVLPRGGRAQPPLRTGAATSASSRSCRAAPTASRIAPRHDPHALEYAVEMRRYDEATTLAARLAAARSATPTWPPSGARSPASTPRAPRRGRDRGRAPRAVVEETLATLAAGAARPRARLDDAARASAAPPRAASARSSTRRATAGLVRDGHGDLRAEHVLLGDPIEPVDGVEFDRGLRVADVGYDLAFLVMDVARHDDDARPRAGARLPRPAAATPAARRPLLAFLCAVRALVRAKVDLLRAAQLTGAARPTSASARALELLDVAERFAWRARLPRIVCVAGLAASGKSTFAEALAAASGRSLLSSDRTAQAARRRSSPMTAPPPSAYSDAESRAVYAELGHRAARRGAPGRRRDRRRDVPPSGRRQRVPGDVPGARRRGLAVCVRRRPRSCSRAPGPRRATRSPTPAPQIVAAELAVHRSPLMLPAQPLARITHHPADARAARRSGATAGRCAG